MIFILLYVFHSFSESEKAQRLLDLPIINLTLFFWEEIDISQLHCVTQNMLLLRH